MKNEALKNIVTRFPPSPTGYLHIGRARTALFNFLFTKKNNGHMVFRLEDTDKERSKEEYVENIVESLKWLGISYDSGPFRQTERKENYKKHLQEIILKGYAYVSKEETGENKEVIRFKNPNKKIKFTDLIRGEIEFDTSDLKDFVIAKNMDEPIYHLAVVVDDYEMNITHIIRGEDHISNTARQILIQEAIGAPRPIYAHIPLILAADRSKLSGRHGAVGVTEYRDRGYLPEALVNYLALLGWNPGTDQEVFNMDELIEKFDFSMVHKGGAIFDIQKLNWLNKEHMKNISEPAFEAEVLKRIPKEISDIPTFDKRIEKILPIIKERISFFAEVETMAFEGELNYLFELPTFDKALLIPSSKMLKGKETSAEEISEVLKKIKDILNGIDIEYWNKENIKSALWTYVEEKGKEYGRGYVLWPLRVALSGRDKSVDPFTICEIIGKDDTLTRLDYAV
jgi:glutamyl-tRNA synthetase